MGRFVYPLYVFDFPRRTTCCAPVKTWLRDGACVVWVQRHLTAHGARPGRTPWAHLRFSAPLRALVTLAFWPAGCRGRRGRRHTDPAPHGAALVLRWVSRPAGHVVTCRSFSAVQGPCRQSRLSQRCRVCLGTPADAAALPAGGPVPRGRFGGCSPGEGGEALPAPHDRRPEVLPKVLQRTAPPPPSPPPPTKNDLVSGKGMARSKWT